MAALPLPSPAAPDRVSPSPSSSSSRGSSPSQRSGGSPGAPELCHGYYDVMGQYDAAFNCSTGAFRFCCGTCHYRFCCEHRARRLEQGRCTNLQTPRWAAPAAAPTAAARPHGDPNHGGHGGGSGGGGGGDGGGSTAYVVCGVVSLALAVAVAARAALGRAAAAGAAAAAAAAAQGNGSRALVDSLRQQAGGLRRSSGAMPPPAPDNGPARPPKSLHGSNKDSGHHSYGLDLGTPEHRAATLDGPGFGGGSLSCSHSFHNLSRPPPPLREPPPTRAPSCVPAPPRRP
ncbi:protein shisa-7 [Cuculus canorus]|uniref:protein shisa-7 n=1 Tax=Cuculus canorus TaxID=55661 RepID=UPI0023AA875F|nr:protein shisa-7 [Cuculus canorus]